MSTEFFNDQWRIPSNENQNKISNYSMDKVLSNSKILSAGSSVNGTSEISVSIWFKSTTGGYVWSFPNTDGGNGFDLSVSSASARVYFLGFGYFSDSFNYIDGNWHHIVVTYDGATLKFYTDGSLNGSHSITTTISNALNEFYVGAFSASYLTLGALGSYDQVSIFDYALSATEVSTLYGGGTAITNPMSLSPKPIAYYQLGDQSVDNGANYLVPNNSLSDYVFSFDGSNDSIVLSNVVDLGINSSVSVWVNLDNNYTGVLLGAEPYNSHYFIQARYDGFFIRIGNVFVSFPLTDNAVTAGNWHHLVVVRSGNSISTYVDNTFIETKTGYGTSVTTKFDTIADRQTSSLPLEGKIAQLSAFNTALSTGNIETLYNNGSPSTDISSLSPVSWYKLNAADTFNSSTSTWTIKDYAGSNDGTSVGMTSANLVVSDLQQTSGYSPYALSFDGTDQFLEVPFSNDLRLTNVDFTISFWTKPSATGRYIMLENYSPTVGWGVFNDNGILEFLQDSGTWLVTSVTIPNNVWTHIVLVGDISATNLQVYKNGVSAGNFNTNLVTGNATGPLTIGAQRNGAGGFDYNGDLSNLSIWSGTALTSTEITEIYNQGVPSNLNTFSGTAPIAWWQLGSNSSFNTNWTCLDEIGTNNAVSANMANDDITNGVGYSANGLGTSSIDIKGDAPYSTANGLSENMDVLDRTTDVAS